MTVRGWVTVDTKRHKLQWYGKAILQGTLKGGRGQSRQKKRWEDNIKEWTGLEFAKSQRAAEDRKKEEEKTEETGCEALC